MKVDVLPKVVPMAKAALIAVAGCVLAAGIGFGAGVWAGIEWQSGQQAKQDATGLRTDVEALHAAAVALRRNGAAIAQDYRTDQRRLEEIVNVHNTRRDETRTLFAEQRQAWAAFAAAHPELAACGVGPDGVRHWNRAATRGAAGASGAAAGGEAGAAPSVPEDPAAAGDRRGAGDAAGVGRRGRAVSRLRRSAARAGGRADRVRGSRVAALLRGDAPAGRPDPGRLRRSGVARHG